MLPLIDMEAINLYNGNEPVSSPNRPPKEVLYMKRIVIACLMLCTLLLASAHAEPIVAIVEDAAGVPDAVIDQIIADYPEAEAILILKWLTAAVPQGLADQIASEHPDAVNIVVTGWQTPDSAKSVHSTIHYRDAARTTTAGPVVLEDQLLCTRAKGSVGPLASPFESTLSSKLTQTPQNEPLLVCAELGMTEYIRLSIPADQVFAGPDENAPQNSREYRVRWVGSTGQWTALFTPTDGSPEPVSGTWAEVEGCVVYAVDRSIEPLGGTP